MPALLGAGILANWGGVVDGADADFNAWHSREHLPERLAVPGFLRGRRCVGVAGTPRELRYFMMYETESPEVLVSAPYLARLNDPTPWTARVLATYLAPCRTVCRTLRSAGCGTGGWLATFAFDERARVRAREACLGGQMRALEAVAGIVGVHVIEGDPEFGQQPTREKAFREAQGMADATVAIALLIEGIDQASVAAAAAQAAAILADVSPVHATLYQTQHILERV